MPHIELKLYPKYDDEKLERLAAELVSAVSQRLEVPERYISVACERISEEDWNERVYRPLIEDREGLLKAPDYN